MSHAASPIPIELQPRPRRVRWTDPRRRFWALAAGLGSVVVFLGGIALAWPTATTVAVALLGEEMAACATAIWRPDVSGGEAQPMAAFVYHVDRVAWVGRTRITPAEFDALAAAGVPRGRPIADAPPGPTSTLMLRILDVGPILRVKASSVARVSPGVLTLDAAIALAWLALVAAMFHAGALRPWRLAWLHRHGVASSGTLKACRISRGWARLEYTFRGPDGAEQHGVQRVAARECAAVREGQAVVVLHPAGKATPSVIYEYGGFRCE
ncbi:MAG: hypothetical protein NTW19_25340 [Planctomycetota bacterium]|nr:hypothetical protein [Planctomycetota bacterium]